MANGKEWSFICPWDNHELDRRVLTKQYGRLFLSSLPQCTVRQGPLANLPKMAETWLGM